MDKVLGSRVWESSLMSTIKGKQNVFMPKLAAMILAALTPEKHTFLFIDDDIEDVDFDEVEADLVTITAMTVQANRAYQIAGEFRKRGIKVVVGGIHAAVMSEEVSSHCDAIMKGESENTWPAMLEDFEAGTLKKVYDAKDYPPVETLVSPRIDIIRHDLYLNYPIQATRGCPYDCDFCSIKFSSGHKYRMKPVEQVVREIQEYEKYNDNRFGGLLKKPYYFVDDNLYVNREYTKALFIALKDLNITWNGQGSINTAYDDEILRLMAESGCRSISIGFESVSQDSLKEANKPRHNQVKEYEMAIQNIQKYGIAAGGYFVMGFDNDGVTVFQETADFVKEVNLVQPIFSILTPYPGTRLYNRLDKEERVFTKGWGLYNSFMCVFTPRKMSSVDLQAGYFWMSREVISMKHLRKSLSYFWKQGPWKSNPRLTTAERIIMILLGMKLAFLRGGRYQRFLFWAATHRRATDFKTIIWMMMRHEISYQSPFAYNPAEKKETN